MSKQKLCYIGNQAPRYRAAIFQAIDKEYDCDWYFGDLKTDIKEMDLNTLSKVVKYPICGTPATLNWKKKTIKLLFCKKYDVFLILAESRCLSDYLFIALSRILRKKVFIWSHGWYGKESKFEAMLKKWQFKHADGVFVYSNYARELMINEGLTADRIFTIHNSLLYDQQKALRESIVPSKIYQEHFGNDNPTIIFIGRLTKIKKLDMILDSVYRLKTKSEYYNVVFVGDGVDRKNLETRVDELGLSDNIWFYGACYDEKQNAELIYNADLCISPGNVGLTAMHALVFGCPVITHNCFKWQMPEFEAIQPGITGDFFEMDNVDSLSHAISKWFKDNPDKREEVRKACFYEIDTQWNPYFQMEVISKNLEFHK